MEKISNKEGLKKAVDMHGLDNISIKPGTEPNEFTATLSTNNITFSFSRLQEEDIVYAGIKHKF